MAAHIEIYALPDPSEATKNQGDAYIKHIMRNVNLDWKTNQ
jgi:hypothetical protein